MRQPCSSKPEEQRIGFEEALKALAATGGQRFAEIFSHGSLAVEIYAPEKIDPQQPHTRDEIYVVARGTGEYLNDGVRVHVKPGDFLFAPAFVEHRFENFSDDFVVWVFFYGPEGGEPD